MAKQPRLHLRGNIYHARVRVPTNLVSIIGKKEIHKSLGTSDWAEAKQRLSIELVRIDAEFAAARRKLTAKPVSDLTEREITQMALLWFHRAETEDFTADNRTDDPDEWIAPDTGKNELLSGVQVDETIRPTDQRIADGLLLEAGIAIERDKPQYTHLSNLIRRAIAESEQRRHDRQEGDHSGRHHDLLFKDVNPVAPEPEKVITPISFRQLADLYQQSPDRRDVSEKTRMSRETIFRAPRRIPYFSEVG